jgi:dihydroorotate dehydrogenase subfamily 1
VKNLAEDISVEIAGVKFRNPVILTAGPTSRNADFILKAAEAGAGGAVTKTISLVTAKVARPCMIKVPGGLLNCEEWSDLDHQTWFEREIPRAKRGGIPIIASIFSLTDDVGEIKKLTSGATDAGADMIEVATSYRVDPLPGLIEAAKEVTDLPVVGKLVLSTFDLVEIAKKCEGAGADAVACMDTVGPCLKIDIETGRPVLGRLSGVGRLSGQAIKPLSLYYVAQIAKTVEIPVIGVGGVTTGDDAVEMIMAGAKAVGVCTATIFNGLKALGAIANGIESFMRRKGFTKIEDFRGLALEEMTKRERVGAVYEGRPPLIDHETCNGCGLCVRSCVYEALTLRSEKAVVNPEKCYGCGLCFSVCPVRAIKLQY